MTDTLRLTIVGGLLVCLCMLVLSVAGCGKPKQAQPGIGYATDKVASDTAWQAGAEKPPMPKTRFAMARVLAAQGRDAEAAVLLQGVIHEAPGSLVAYVDLAGIRMRQRDPAAAVDVLTAGLKVAPKDPVLLNDLGMAYLSLGHTEKALSVFEQAAAAAPRQSRYHCNPALALAMLGRYDEALTAYERVMPPSEAHHNVAIVCEWRDDKERATVERARSLMTAGQKRACGSHGVVAARPAEGEELTADVHPAVAPRTSPVVADSPATAMMPISVVGAMEPPVAAEAAGGERPQVAPQIQPAAGWEYFGWSDVCGPVAGMESRMASPEGSVMTSNP